MVVFPAPQRSYKSDLLARLCIHVDVMKNDLVGAITKIHILQNHVTFQLDIIRGTLSFMEMFPCPAAYVSRIR